MAYNYDTTIGFNPDKALKQDMKPRILKAQFGDGYMQRARDGINTVTESWSLSWKNRKEAEGKKLVDFFESTGGIHAITWTPPYATVAIKVIVENWNVSYPQIGILTIQAKFTRVHDL
jgi:phage-related protein